MTSLNTRRLGKTPLQVTEFGFGGGAIGGLYAPVAREQAFEALQMAWDLGVRYFDTAPYYGHGRSERYVGDFLRDKSGYVLSTKVGILLQAARAEDVPNNGFVDPLPFRTVFDYSYDAILRSVDDSLLRLGLSALDVLWVHAIERGTIGTSYDHHMEVFLGSGIRALDRLKSEGIISGYGLGVNEVEPCMTVMQRVPLDCIMLANRFTLLDRRAEEQLIPLCTRMGTGVVVGGVFNSGVLASGAHSGAHFDYAPAPDSVLRRVSAMEAVALAQGGSLVTAALQFPLAYPTVSSVVIGSAKASSLARNIKGYEPRRAWDWSEFNPYAIHNDADLLQ